MDLRAVVNTVMNLRVPWQDGISCTVYATLILSGGTATWPDLFFSY